ncbi:Mrp/NBP35 family ATP-binding protein [Candidatus Galacturonibacter soehngenii]|uniref:Iron-sulfur cluster carrier protein n=1 Tax=Candidatus Galacturonatibacter soehngenii TaxID=2307010 RepID=A0A7V7QN53_9FIRM|nr:Mrp/NBP35 family ATP-binding protein [Candidatus Galacturonibacter soehngenii]KAB1440409.1 Mrp/NBP35 family ATP-binding protein [Candidatus Galacturonibacter soehngenii]MBA4688931.1 Mrp/NBP35 family ATP-binding protein [Candidatus Galacturonibacter soehngenii]
MSEKSCNNSECSKESCEGCPSKGATQSFLVEPNIHSNVKKVIGVVSGKGGVGKSMITASLATLMQQQGYQTGILDADITGPSIPKMFGLKGPAQGTEEGIYPEEAKNGTKVMSVNLLMEDEEAPVIWRGPVISNMVKQFWSDVMWGELDFLFVDMPPGTGDVPLTVFQSLPVDGIVVVTSPQDLVSMIVKKAYHMAKTMNIPIIGIVENYSFIKCPDCDKKIKVFGESHIDEIAGTLGLEVLGKVPIEPDYASAADAGEFYRIKNDYIQKASQILTKL